MKIYRGSTFAYPKNNRMGLMAPIRIQTSFDQHDMRIQILQDPQRIVSKLGYDHGPCVPNLPSTISAIICF